MKTRETFIATNKLKLTCVESLSLKVLGHLLNFITWKEKDHITQEGNDMTMTFSSPDKHVAFIIL